MTASFWKIGFHWIFGGLVKRFSSFQHQMNVQKWYFFYEKLNSPLFWRIQNLDFNAWNFGLKMRRKTKNGAMHMHLGRNVLIWSWNFVIAGNVNAQNRKTHFTPKYEWKKRKSMAFSIMRMVGTKRILATAAASRTNTMEMIDACWHKYSEMKFNAIINPALPGKSHGDEKRQTAYIWMGGSKRKRAEEKVWE